MINVDEIPDPRESPVGSARHHLQRAFAALRCKLTDIHAGVVHAHALAARDHRAGLGVPAPRGTCPTATPALEALARELEEVQAAEQMCERLLWRAVGDPAAQARWVPGDLAVLRGRVVRVLRVMFGTTPNSHSTETWCDVLLRPSTLDGDDRQIEHDVRLADLTRPPAPQWRVGDVAGAAGACDRNGGEL